MNVPKRAQTLADRAVMTGAASALTYLGNAAAFDALTIDWIGVLGFFAGGAAFSLLGNLARGGITGRTTPQD